MVINRSNVFEKVYGFTNENVLSYQKILEFSGASVLSVIGSGDQYFCSLLYGAKDVTLFDINNCAYYYFILKFYAIRVLSFEEFVDFFFLSNLENGKLYSKIYPYLPENTRYFFDYYLGKHKSFAKMRLRQNFTYDSEGFEAFSALGQVPYMNPEGYYKLQEMLRSNNIPDILLVDLLNLKELLKKKYDVVLLSNIYLYLGCSVKEFSKLLDGFGDTLNTGAMIQANYIWNSYKNCVKEFTDEGYIPYQVNGHYSTKEIKEKDTVLVYKR